MDIVGGALGDGCQAARRQGDAGALVIPEALRFNAIEAQPNSEQDDQQQDVGPPAALPKSHLHCSSSPEKSRRALPLAAEQASPNKVAS